MSLWVPSPNYTPGRPPGGLRWVVWHSTEGNETRGAARAVAANWFALRSSQVSAHVVVDDGADPRYPDGVVECVKPQDTAWHCGPNGNGGGYGVEIVGRAAQSAIDWSDAYSRAALRNAAAWITGHPALGSIPRRWLTDEQLRGGERGHITHAQVSRVLGGSTHTDPGPGFPDEVVLAYLEQNGEGDVQLSDRVRDLYRDDGATMTLGDTWTWGTAHAAHARDRATEGRDAARQAVADVAALRAQLTAQRAELATLRGDVARILALLAPAP